MSAVIKSSGGDLLDNIFIFYDFSQVKDAVLIVTYFESLRRWDKVFIFFINDQWETESLLMRLSATKYEWLCKKLDFIFKELYAEESINLNEEMQKEADFIIALNAM